MKKLWLSIPVVLISVWVAEAQIIIDHRCTHISAIPSEWITAAKTKLHIAYGHTSHGSQLISGMTGLISFANGGGSGLKLPNNIFIFNNGGSGGALDLHDYAMGGDVGYYPDWVNNTRNYLGPPDDLTGRGTGAHADVNVVIWSWCGQVSSQTEASMISNYLTPMSQLGQDYPGIKFVYMTGHLDGTGTSGNLNIRNEQIRKYCRDNKKILYDFADIESYDPDGLTNYMALMANDNCDYDSDRNGSRDRNWAIDWQNSHKVNTDWYVCSTAHSQSLNGNLKAFAAWHLWAELAGWPGITGIEAPGKNDIPKVYPNPVSDEMTIETTVNSQTVIFEILNTTGQVVCKGSFTGKAKIKTKGLSPGIYLVRIESYHAFELIKILKK